MSEKMIADELPMQVRHGRQIWRDVVDTKATATAILEILTPDGQDSPVLRFARPNRGHAANANHDFAAARRRRQRAVIELRQAEAAARRRARRGRRFVADVEEAKAALWLRLFGAELSPNLIAALAYVDVQERLAKLTNGGWVRDEGDRLIASGADSTVVALLVETAKAKGWKFVRIWGAEDFIKEARCQFEAVGIPVIVVDPPPASMVQRADEAARQPDADAVIAELVQSRIDAEVRLARVIRPEPEPKSVIDARAKEREADAAWRMAIRRHDEARVALEEAECQMQDAGIFAKYGAKKRLAKAKEQFEICSERLRELLDAHKRAKVWLDDRQAAYERAEARRRADRVSWERRARADVEFAAACERVATESRGLALKGVRAVEQAAYERLLSRRAGDETPSATEDEVATSVTIPP